MLAYRGSAIFWGPMLDPRVLVARGREADKKVAGTAPPGNQKSGSGKKSGGPVSKKVNKVVTFFCSPVIGIQ